MEELFKRHITRLVPQAQEKRYLLAVSGGADSSVMAYLFYLCGLSFAIAHCNFHLRGEESDKDMKLVRKKAEQYGVRYFEKEFDTVAFQKQEGLSLEMAARKLRYDWFSQINKDFDFVVTAHNANDNAETFLLNMTRGTGLKGLTAIPEKNGKLLRPLLLFPSAQIRRFADEKGIEYRNDATNFVEDYQRNKIRLSVIPKLEELNPELINVFSRNIDLLRRQFQFYQQQMNNTKLSLISMEGDTVRVSIEGLKHCDDPLLVLYELLKDYGFSPSLAHQILDSTDKFSGKQFFSSEYRLVKDRRCLFIKKIGTSSKKENYIDNIDDFKRLGFKVEEFDLDHFPDFDTNPNVLYADSKKLAFPLILRNWRKGDRFYPLGMKGSKKVSDFFINQKVNLIEKEHVPILCCGEKIVWLVGFRGDDRFKLDHQTKKYYKITYHGSF